MFVPRFLTYLGLSLFLRMWLLGPIIKAGFWNFLFLGTLSLHFLNMKNIRIHNLGYSSSVSMIPSITSFFLVSLVYTILSANIPVKASGLSRFTAFAGPQTNNQELLHFRPASASGRYLAGRYAHQRRDYVKAADYLNEVLKNDKSNPKIRRMAFFSLIGSGQIAQAAILAEKIGVSERGAGIAILSLIVEDALEGRFDKAEKRLSSISKRGVSRFAAPLLLAWIKSAQGDIAGAVKAVESTKKNAAFKALRNLHLGLIYEQADKTKLAEQALREAAKNSISVRAIMAYGSFLERQGRNTEAKRIIKKQKRCALMH